MKFIYVHPDDARWLRHWLRSNVCCFFAIVGFLLLLRMEPIPVVTTIRPAQAQHSAIDPKGWRLTQDGWENASRWAPAPRPLAEIILTQQRQEPAWMQRALAQIRAIPPITYATIQLAFITLIVRVVRPRSVQRDDAACANDAPFASRC